MPKKSDLLVSCSCTREIEYRPGHFTDNQTFPEGYYRTPQRDESHALTVSITKDPPFHQPVLLPGPLYRCGQVAGRWSEWVGGLRIKAAITQKFPCAACGYRYSSSAYFSMRFGLLPTSGAMSNELKVYVYALSLYHLVPPPNPPQSRFGSHLIEPGVWFSTLTT